MNVARVWQNTLFGRTVGAFYARAIEQRRATRILGRVIFGTDVDLIYSAMDGVTRLPDGCAVLDVPCGGGITAALQPPGRQVRYVAADISPAMLDHARRRLDAGQLRTIELVQTDIEAMPFGDAEFDLCVCFNGLHCLPDPAAAIAEIARVLKPGGRLIGDFVTRGRLRRSDAYIMVLRASGTFGPGGTVDDARRWFTDAGLTVDELECSGAITHFAVHR